jgi:hypothetical protein
MSLDLPGFRKAVDGFAAALRAADPELSAVKLAADKWSLREIVGHLVDSASNNHQRFVRLRDSPRLQFPGYQGERWVEIQRPNLLPWPTLTALWESYNELLLHLAAEAEARVECLSHVWETPEGPRTLEFLIADYYRHLGDHTEHFRRRLAELG